ncbi:MAG: cadherin-like domain-containing protein [Luteolibacter sp.]|uniref:cadherin-like domain-containing protein n=1 Tax=Luteolibacter sp. TaxID=1962973 RepID=UPI0032634E51
MKSFRSVLRVLGLLAFGSLGVTVCEAQTPPVRILPLGDSLTSGVSTSVVPGAYRNRLYSLLTTAGYNVDFVGTNTDSSNPTLPDKDHQGVGGARIDEIQTNLAGWLNTVEDPDVVLLLIGTNDFSQNFNLGSIQTRWTNLIADIATKRPFAKIIVSNLPLRTDSAGLESQQVSFNSALAGIVNNQVLLGRQVSLVDMHSAWVPSDLVEGVHPNQGGYNKMADVWLPAIGSVISPLGTTNPPAIVRTGPPTTPQQLTVRFSKPLADSAATPANFTINGGLSVSAASLDVASKRIMTLTTSSQAPGTLYTLSVTGVRDRTAAQTLITPGSTIAFSTDAQTNGSFEADFAGWTTSGNLEIKNAAPYAPTNGAKLVAFNAGQLTPNGVVSQTFSTTVGIAYVLAFDAGALGANAQQRMQVNVTGGSSLVSQIVTVTAPGGAGSTWAPQSFSFVANSTTTTMTFTDISTTSNSVDLLLDNVRLTTQVPRTLTVSSTPTTGVNVTLSPADLNGASGAPTGFSRQYVNGTVVTISAPSVVGANAFVKWQRNGVDLTTSSSTTVTLDGDYTLNAVYSANNQVLNNGSFENGYTGWTQTGNQEIKSLSPYIASDGTKLVAFNTGNLAPNGILSQTFPTTSGATYTVAFDAGVYSFNTSTQSLQVSVTGSGSVLSQVVNLSANTNGTTRWFPQSFTFVANNASSTITFRDQSPTSAGLDLILDNVRVTGPPGGPVNNSPVAVAESYTTNQNIALVVAAPGVLANDTDNESNPLTAVIGTTPAHGSVVLNSNGGFTYTPTTGYSGPDSFTYRANDGNSFSSFSTVSLTVNAIATGSLVNGSFESGETGWTMTGNHIVYPSDANYVAFDGTKMLVLSGGSLTPDAVISQTFGTTPGQSYQLTLNVGVFGNNGIEQRLGVALTGTAPLVTQTASVFGTGASVSTWTPKTYAFTADSATTTLTFTDLTVTSTGADLLVDNVAVAATVANAAPVAVADSYSTPLNTALVVAASGVLANDTDANSDPLTAVIDATTTHGALVLNANGGFTYTPTTGYVGPDSFTYHANDGTVGSNVVTASITVSAGSQLLVNGSFEAGTPANIGPVDGWTMSGNQPTPGAPTAYVPDGGYPATVPDGVRLLILNAGGDIFTGFVSQQFTTVPGSTYSLSLNVGVFSSGVAGKVQRLQIGVQGTASLLSQTEEVTSAAGIAVLAAKNYTFVADSGTTTLTLSDASAGVVPGTANLSDLLVDNVSVNGQPGGPPNTAPVAVADSYSTNQNTALVVAAAGVLANDTDAETNPLTAALVANVTHGTLALAANGGFTYTPTTGYTGPDSFTYKANDGLLNSNTVTVSLTVNSVPTGALVNGSFESGFAGWTNTGAQSIQSTAPYAATDGSKLVSFNDGNLAPSGVLSQTFGTVAGATYTLAFDAGLLSYNTNPQKIQAKVDGTSNLLTQVVTVSRSGGSNMQWFPQTFTFVANSVTTTLTFTDQSASTSGLDLTLDNVRVTGPPAGNSAPIAVADSYPASKDTALVVAAAGVLSNDTDAQSNTLTAAVVANVTHGTLVLAANGGFTYTPTTGYTGPDSFTYKANDGEFDSNVVTVSITVSTPISQLLVNGSFESNFTGWTNTGNLVIESASPYTATNGTKLAGFNGGNLTPNGVLSQTFTTVAGQTYTLTFDAGVLSFNFSPQKLLVTADGTASLLNQLVTVNGTNSGTNVWTPKSFTFVADSTVTTLTFRDQSASTGGIDLTLDNVSVTGPPGVPNTAPVAVADSYSTFQGTALVVASAGVLSNDTDAELSPLTAVLGTGPAHGTLTLNANGGFTYTPAGGYSGSDSFTYRANDGVLNSNLVTVSITVTPVSVGGLANGSFELGEASWTMTGNRLAYDSTAPYVAFNGTKLLILNAGQTTPDAVVTQAFATTPGQAYHLTYNQGFLASNGAEQKLQVTVTGATPLLSQTDSVFGNSAGNTQWTSRSYNFTADSSVAILTFTDVSPTGLGIDQLLDNVSVSVVVPNTAPVAVADSYSANLNTALVINAATGVLANDTDAQSDPLTAVQDSGPSHGTLTLNPNGSFTYTPTTTYTGPDSFTYHANDGTVGSNVVTVSLTVNSVATSQLLVNGSFELDETGWTMTGNRFPYASDGSYVAFDGTKMMVLSGGSNTPDAVISQTFGTIPGQSYALTFNMGVLSFNNAEQKLNVNVTGATTLINQAESVFGNSGGNSVWTPKSFNFVADSATTTLTFTDLSPTSNLIDLLLDNVSVTGPPAGPANTAPTAVADSYSANQNTPLVVAAPGVLANDTDPESNPLAALTVGNPAHGTLALSANGGFTYTPTSGYTGPDSFTYKANDGLLDSNTVTVSLNVSAAFGGLVNGSFESNFTGWTTTGAQSIQSSAPYVPTNGSKLVSFNDGNLAPSAVLSQTFNTVAGQTYTLTFDVGVLSYVTTQQKLLVTVDGTGSLLSQLLTINTTATNSNTWTPRSFTFTANSATSTLTFRDQSTVTAGLDMTLDNVVVTGPGGGSNTAPVAVADTYSTPMNTALVVAAAGVLTNDTDAQSNPLTAAVVANVSHGTLSLAANGGFTYTPTTSYTGPDSFTYKANDGLLDSNTVTVSLTVSAPGVNGLVNGSFESDFTGWTTAGNVVIQNTAPYAPTDGTKLAAFNSGNTAPNGVLTQTFATTPGTSYSLAFDAGTLAFNTSQQKIAVSVTGTGSLLSQTVTITGVSNTTKWTAQSFTFVANSASTTLSFTDTSTTGSGLDLVLDNVRVFSGASGLNTAPVATDDNYSTTQGTALVVATPGVLGNDIDAETNPMTAILVAGPASGSLTLNPNGGFTYTPVSGFSGTATFTYKANDGLLDSTTATVSISVSTVGALVNGSFETGVLAPWTASGGTVDSARINSVTGGTDGTKIVEFNASNSPNGGSITQTFTTTPGIDYILTFDLGVYAFNTSLQSLQVTATGSGSLLNQTASINGIGGGTVKWVAKSYNFTANSTTTTLKFTDTSSTTNSIDVLLDNVRVINANARILTVDSVIGSNVAMIISPGDNNGNANGSTLLTRNYNLGSVVSLTAPGTAPNGATFAKWVKDGVDFAVTPATSVTISANTSMVAVYSGGTFAPLGSNIVQNGSFESLDGSSWATSWNRANSSNRIEQPGSASGFPSDGNNMLSFNVGGTPTTGVASQTLATTVGTTYTLQLDVSAYAPGISGISQSLNVAVEGSGILLSRTVSIVSSGTTTVWAPQTFTFTANTTATTLFLADASSTGNGTDLFVDNVRIRPGTLAPVTLAVNSTPAAGKVITVSTPDLAGQGNGTTGFSRIYAAGTTVNMVAPYANFVKWLKNGAWYATNPTISVVVDANTTMTAVYTTTPVLGPFTNGSFESEFTGWTWSGSQQSVKVKDGLPSTDGLIVVEFNSNSSGLDGSITQTFTTTPGTLYTLTFDIGTKAFNTSNQTLKCQVTGSSSLVNQNFSITGTGGGNVNYAGKTVTFTANSTSTTLTFSDQSTTGDGLDLLLDNVRLNGSTGASAIPLPPQESLAIAPIVPTNGDGGLGSASLTATAPGEFRISSSAAVDGVYFLQRSEDLSTWETIEEKEFSAGPIEFNDASASETPKSRMFYRIGGPSAD